MVELLNQGVKAFQEIDSMQNAPSQQEQMQDPDYQNYASQVPHQMQVAQQMQQYTQQPITESNPEFLPSNWSIHEYSNRRGGLEGHTLWQHGSQGGLPIVRHASTHDTR